MANGIDFVLPSCYGIPEPMWLVVSNMIEVLIRRCWLLLGAFVIIKMIVGAFIDLGEERFSPASHIKITFQAFLIAIFLLYYKTILMTFDYLIESLCSFQYEVIQQAEAQANSGVIYENAFVKWIIHFTSKLLGSPFAVSQTWASFFMHYVKSVSLLVLAVLGPLSALFSLLPGPFKSSFKSWSRGYINVSCWTISLAIIDTLEVTFHSKMFHEGDRSIFISLALFIVTFFVPTWTSKLISGVDLGSIVAGMARAPGTIGEIGKGMLSGKRGGN